MTQPSDRRCARAEHCGNAEPTDQGLAGAWAEPGSPYCRRCTTAAARTLWAMPARYAWLRHHIGYKPAGHGDPVSGSREAPLPLRLDIDALICDMVLILVSWEERVADQAGLDRPAADVSRRRRDEVAIPAAVATLHPRMDMLLQLPPQPMMRTATLTRNAPPPPAGSTGVVYPLAGFIRYNQELSGADAGREIFRLAWMSRRLLGETIPPPATLDGIPCKGCNVLALEVCGDPEYRSECAACGDLLTPGEYLEWVRWYAAWARDQVAGGTVTPADPGEYQRLAA